MASDSALPLDAGCARFAVAGRTTLSESLQLDHIAIQSPGLLGQVVELGFPSGVRVSLLKSNRILSDFNLNLFMASYSYPAW
jgi:hypothetical protein